MNPIIPHFSNECLMMMSDKNLSLHWPQIDSNLLEDKLITFVIQINGKKRGLIISSKDTSEVDLIKLVENSEEINKYLVDKTIKKKIFVPNKLLNIIL